jgi:ATP-binding cassette subfamily C protein CydC
LRQVLLAAGLLPMSRPAAGLDTRLAKAAWGFRAASRAAWRLRGCSCATRRCGCSTSRLKASTAPTARDVMARLSERAKGRSLVIATHIRREAAIADVIATLDGGRITRISRRGETAFEEALNRLRPD